MINFVEAHDLSEVAHSILNAGSHVRAILNCLKKNIKHTGSAE
jgi:hypothetical protein